VGLVLRIRADDPAARCNLGDKYGAEEDEVEPLLRVAREQGLNVVGISFHVGSGARDPQAFPIAVQKAREAFDMGITYGHKMRVRTPGSFLNFFSFFYFLSLCALWRPSVQLYWNPADRDLSGSPCFVNERMFFALCCCQ
jgi:hypothetical protein